MPRMLVIVLGLAILVSSWTGTVGNIQRNCPSRCECSLTRTPHILCRELFSLPRVIPQKALSLHCISCPIARMTGNIFHKYTHLRQLSLAGSSQPIFDEQTLHFLRSIPELFLTGYVMSPSDLLMLVGPDHTLTVQNISLVAPSTSPVDAVATSY